jgi:FAD/FMN-containing dehydrogenase
VLQYCHERRIGVVPQAGNTGLVGGSVGLGSEIILSVEQLNHIHGLDPNSGILKSQSGCILQELQDYAAVQDHLVPVDLGAKGTCQIGGNISTNAGGSYYYRYGSLHANTMGLEVVLPDGTILNLGYDPCHLKDNTGYDLKHLFIGAEGTLGVITNVALLCPRLPKSKCAAFLACETYEEVYHTLDMAKSRLGEVLAAFEFMDQTILELVMETHGDNLSFPLSGIPSYSILVETHGSNEEHDHEKLQDFVETAFVEGLVKDGAVAQSLSQVQDFWKIRESCNPSVATQGYVYKYDVSLAVTEFEDFIQEIRNGLSINTGDAICTNWGHVIDGNLHLNVVVPGQPQKDEELYERIESLVLDGILSRGGSISAEHGLGQYKNKHMTKIKDASTLQTMRQVKALFDPHGIMNPGKYLP